MPKPDYRKAEAATGIPWEVLAAVNLVETGMGRIDGISVANAQGPMQFLPSTRAERGIGKGDIRDPHDAKTFAVASGATTTAGTTAKQCCSTPSCLRRSRSAFVVCTNGLAIGYEQNVRH